MVFVTGDCHGDFRKLHVLAELQTFLRQDYVIICGDFGGIWHDSPNERYALDRLNELPFTTLFIDGNHENFDRLYSNEFETIDFHGGKAHRIRDNIFYLMRGHIFSLDNHTFFAMGGARSHDIQDGILDERHFPNHQAFLDEKERLDMMGACYRINHRTWWRQEMPSEAEFISARKNLEAYDHRVDYIITHDCPYSTAKQIYGDADETELGFFFDYVLKTTDFSHWYFGHHHLDRDFGKLTALYDDIIRII